MGRPLLHRHRLERQSDLLAAAMKDRVAVVAKAITPPGARPPFTRRLSASETLDWWLKHRYDPIGQAEAAKLTPVQVQELDAWLAQAVQGAGGGGQAGKEPLPTPSEVIGPAMAQERRGQGPAVNEAALGAF